MSWWYFNIVKEEIFLADSESFDSRPDDANPCNNDPYTPWYQLEDHIDDSHIHIKANSFEKAYAKAITMIKEKREMSTKKTITYGDDYHVYQDVFEDENVYLQIDKHEGYVCIDNDRITLKLSPYLLDKIAKSWLENRDKIDENP